VVPDDVVCKSHYKLDQTAPIARVDDFATDDVGAGTRFGRVSSQMVNRSGRRTLGARRFAWKSRQRACGVPTEFLRSRADELVRGRLT
jgi:hypothetical protein